MGKNNNGVVVDVINKGQNKVGKRRSVITTERGNMTTNHNNQTMKYKGVKTKEVYKDGAIKRKKVTDIESDNGKTYGVVVKTRFKDNKPIKEVTKDYATGRVIKKLKGYL